MQPIKDTNNMKKDLKDTFSLDQVTTVPVVFTVNKQKHWILVACPENKIQELEESYARMSKAKTIDLPSELEKIGAEIREGGLTEEIVENGIVIGRKIPKEIRKFASCIIGHEKKDPALPDSPDSYMPDNDNSP
jgi:hypothetical protein